MISHLRMEGKYEFHQADDEIAKHTHVMFTFYRWHAITLFRCTEIWPYDIGS